MAAAYRGEPIKAFAIPSGGPTLTPIDWTSRGPQLWYGLAEEEEYAHPAGGVYRRCRVGVFKDRSVEEDSDDDGVMGYLPLPLRYANAWTQLCYSVVYWLWQWTAWVNELPRPPRCRRQPANFVRDCMHNAGARFLKYLTVRRLVTEELLRHNMSKDGSDQLLVFDEYLIRDRFDWLWSDIGDIPQKDLGYLELDPVHPGNAKIFSWGDKKLLVPEEMIPPAESPGHLTWIWGNIRHFDAEKSFIEAFPDVLRFYRSKTLRARAEHMPYSAADRVLPERWHEYHEPAIRFLTEDEDKFFGHTHVSPRAGTSGPAPPPQSMDAEGAPVAGPSKPLEGHSGVVDDPQTREIVAAFAQCDGGINLPEAHERLQSTLGAKYDAKVWGRLLDDVVCAPGEEPARSVEEAFQFYGNGGGEEDSHAKSMESYRQRNRTLL